MKPPQRDKLQSKLGRGLEAAFAAMPPGEHGTPAVALQRVSTCTIADIDHGALTGVVPNDIIAGVLKRFEEPLRGTALLALDPGDALLWLQRDGTDAPPLERFVALGGLVLAAVVESLCEGKAGAADASPGLLEERPLVAALLATHAPSDTIVLSLDAHLSFELDPAIGTLHTPFTMQLLLEPKMLQGLVGELEPEA